MKHIIQIGMNSDATIIPESKMEVPIDLQELLQGIYMVIFRNSTQRMIRKIVINKQGKDIRKR